MTSDVGRRVISDVTSGDGGDVTDLGRTAVDIGQVNLKLVLFEMQMQRAGVVVLLAAETAHVGGLLVRVDGRRARDVHQDRVTAHHVHVDAALLLEAHVAVRALVRAFALEVTQDVHPQARLRVELQLAEVAVEELHAGMFTLEVAVHLDGAALLEHVGAGGAVDVVVVEVVDVAAEVARRLERPAAVRALQQPHLTLLHGRVHAVTAHARDRLNVRLERAR